MGDSFAYRGIPYAAPPVGALRFAPPAPAAPWSTPRDGAQWGACCPQLTSSGAVGQEDCLTLNVWTPMTRSAPRPVLVFIHGGGNAVGCSAMETAGERVYEGDVLAGQHDAVVVTFNYRLGALGFLSHAALGKESSNSALRDQQAALAWVKRNAAAFGGDPEKVLLFGQSAGGTDVCAQLLSPQAKGLFSRALIESGDCAQSDLATAQKTGAQVAATVGCVSGDIAACLRATPVAALLKAGDEIEWGPTTDGAVLTDRASTVLTAGTHNHMPVVIGANSAEMLLFARNMPIPDDASYRQRLAAEVGSAAPGVAAHYPAAAYGGSAKEAYLAAFTDARFWCPARSVARLLSTGQTEPVYRYLFPHALTTRRRVKDSGATHGLELLFVFGHLHVNGYRPTAGDLALSAALGEAWTRFARTGDPSSAAQTWPRYDAATDDYVILDEKMGSGQKLHSAGCDFWDGL